MGPPPWTLELVALASAAGLTWSGMTGVKLAAYMWWAAFGIVLAFVDLAVYRLPARLSHAATGGLLAMLLVDAWVTHTWQPWVRAALGALIAGAAVAACALALPALVHWGDARYALAMGAAAAWAGWLALYAAAFLATLGAALVGLVLIAARRASMTTQVPQGAFLYGGALLAVVLVLHR